MEVLQLTTNMSFKTWWEQWYNICTSQLSYGTRYEYNIFYDKHYCILNDMLLQDIKPINIIQVMNTTQCYSNSRQRKVFFILQKVFKDALINGYIERNPMEQLTPPKKLRKEVETFSEDEIKIILSNPFDDPTGDMIALQLFAGLRRGELLSLKWENVNYDKKVIFINSSISVNKGGTIDKDSTKNNVDRIIPITDNIELILNRIKKRFKSDNYLFPNKDGKNISLKAFHERYLKYFQQLTEKYPNVKYRSSHKLRHTFATFLLQNGADIKSVSTLLGHTNLQTTQIYLHTDVQHLFNCCNKLNFDLNSKE